MEWYLNGLLEPFGATLGLGGPWGGLGAILFLVGIFRSWRQAPLLTAGLLGPIIVTAFAALGHFYPWQGRLLIFLSPSLAWFLAEGTWHVLETLFIAKYRVAAWAVGIVLAAGLGFGAHTAFARFSPFSWDVKNTGTEEVMKEIQASGEPYDSIYVNPAGAMPFRVYSLINGYRWNRPVAGITFSYNPAVLPESISAIAQETAGNLAGNRTWVFIGQTSWRGTPEAYLRSRLDQKGKFVKRVQCRDTFALLYDFSGR